MDKKVLGIIMGIVIIVLFIFSYMLWNKKGTDDNLPPVVENIINTMEEMPETNPFETNVNPMDGYKNPFEE
jgi:predicted negative regulator of RcsB-dependent stress response